MEAHQKACEELETANLSSHSARTVESGEKPDETDVKKLLQPAPERATSDTREPRQANGWH